MNLGKRVPSVVEQQDTSEEQSHARGVAGRE